MSREELHRCTRIVVKFGTGILTDERNLLDTAKIERLVEQIAALHRQDKEIVIVTSGAVGAGMGILELKKRPTLIPQLQACAALGQPQLVSTYQQLFAARQIRTAQVLLTRQDLKDHDRHLNARSTLTALLAQKIVPIINENDTVSVAELKFGDNDILSSLVACLLPSDLLIMLTTADGLIDRFDTRDARRIGIVETVDRRIERIAKDTKRPTATGGMTSKLQAAKIASRSGIPTLIGSGQKPDTLQCVMAGEDEGTLILSSAPRLKGKKRWIAFFHHPRGSLIVDDGAKIALRENGKSLLAKGVVRTEGEFERDEVVSVCDLNGAEFGRGMVDLDSAGFASRPIPVKIAVHRNRLVIL